MVVFESSSISQEVEDHGCWYKTYWLYSSWKPKGIFFIAYVRVYVSSIQKFVSQLGEVGRLSIVVVIFLAWTGELSAAFEKHLATYGGLDICINSAGIGNLVPFYKDQTNGSGSWRRTINVNLAAVIDCTRLAVCLDVRILTCFTNSQLVYSGNFCNNYFPKIHCKISRMDFTHELVKLFEGDLNCFITWVCH